MEAFKVNVYLILLHMDHQYKGLHLHSFQMEQRGDDLLLMKFKRGLFNRKLTANRGDHWNTTDRALGGMRDQMNLVAQPKSSDPHLPPPLPGNKQ